MGQDEYVEVYAQSTFARDAENPSGGEETTFAHVSWTRDGGFTNSGSWYTETYETHDPITGDFIPVWGPTHGKTPEEIVAIIDSETNLNSLFTQWENDPTVTLDVRSGWISFVENYSPNCVEV